MDEMIKRWTAGWKSALVPKVIHGKRTEAKASLLLLALLAAMCCYAQTPSHARTEDYPGKPSSSKCLSQEEINREIEKFSSALANGSMPSGQTSPQAAAKAESEGFVGDFAVLASRHSTNISYLEMAPDEFSAPVEHVRFPENACVVSFVLSAPEALRKKCDDNGAYGVWYTFSVHNGDIYISDVSGNINPECSEFR